MTELDKLVDSMSEDTRIYLGSKSSFFFIGTKAEYERDIDVISAKLLNGYIRTARNAAKEARKRFTKLHEAAKGGELPEPEEYDVIAEKVKSYLKNTAYAARFVSVRQREICMHYGGIEAGSMKIIVQGDEEGAYWLPEEYAKARARA